MKRSNYNHNPITTIVSFVFLTLFVLVNVVFTFIKPYNHNFLTLTEISTNLCYIALTMISSIVLLSFSARVLKRINSLLRFSLSKLKDLIFDNLYSLLIWLFNWIVLTFVFNSIPQIEQILVTEFITKIEFNYFQILYFVLYSLFTMLFISNLGLFIMSITYKKALTKIEFIKSIKKNNAIIDIVEFKENENEKAIFIAQNNNFLYFIKKIKWKLELLVSFKKQQLLLNLKKAVFDF